MNYSSVVADRANKIRQSLNMCAVPSVGAVSPLLTCAGATRVRPSRRSWRTHPTIAPTRSSAYASHGPTRLALALSGLPSSILRLFSHVLSPGGTGAPGLAWTCSAWLRPSLSLPSSPCRALLSPYIARLASNVIGYLISHLILMLGGRHPQCRAGARPVQAGVADGAGA